MEVREPSAKYLAKPAYKQTEVGVIPEDWDCVQLTTVAQLESGHTPSRRHPEYWGGDIPWVSLHDTDSLDAREIQRTAQTVTPEGISNSSARLLPQGTVVFSRTATVGKATTLGREMATSQDFANYICGPRVLNHFLVYLFRWMAPEWKKLMAGSIHNTVYMPAFKTLKVILPPRAEQQAVAEALSDADALIEVLEQLLAKKRQIKQGAMQELLTGQRRLPGFAGEWEVKPMQALGQTYGGLTGKSKGDFGHGSARYIPFMNVMSSIVIDHNWFERVDVLAGESQNLAQRGDLFFNGSSETPEEVGFCSVLMHEISGLYLNSFCFGFRIYPEARANGLFLAYWFRSRSGRKSMSLLAQGAIRYNIAKSAFLKLEIPQPTELEQTAIASALSDMDAELAALEEKLAKARAVKQGMMQELLTGRIRLI